MKNGMKPKVWKMLKEHQKMQVLQHRKAESEKENARRTAGAKPKLT